MLQQMTENGCGHLSISPTVNIRSGLSLHMQTDNLDEPTMSQAVTAHPHILRILIIQINRSGKQLFGIHAAGTRMSLIFRKLASRRMLRMDIFLTILGALIGWGVSHVYYWKALNDVKADAEERQRVEELVLRGIESVGDIKYSRDASGKVVGVVVELKGSASASATATGDLTVGHTGTAK